MKKILAIILTVAMATTLLCSTAMAGSVAPVYWDLEIELRKADPNNVKKDGIIGENEYKKLEINKNLLWINYNTEVEDGVDVIKTNAAKVSESLEYYFSWDETNGFNFAVRFKPIGNTNDFPADYHEEPIMSTPFGGVLFEAFYSEDPNYTPKDKSNGTLIYAVASQNTTTGDLLSCMYNGQHGYKDNYNITNDNVFIAFDSKTGYVTYEWSVPLDALIDGTPAVGSEFYFLIGASCGEGNGSQGWGACGQNHFSVNLGQWGFYMGQSVCLGGKATVAKLSDVAVDYVEPEKEEPADNNTVDIVIMVVEAVVIIVLLAALVIKKKKQ